MAHDAVSCDKSRTKQVSLPSLRALCESLAGRHWARKQGVGGIRRQCVDHGIIAGQRHLREETMSSNRHSFIDTQALPLWGAALPLITINVCYVVGVAVDHLPSCIPYFSGCTSVSSTGRAAPESLIFRAGMVPSALLLMFVWQRCATFLALGGCSRTHVIILRVLSIVVALSLTVYALTLGFESGGYRQLRRIATNTYAATTVAAQIAFIASYRTMQGAVRTKLWWWLVAFCAALPLLKFASEIAQFAGVFRRYANSWAAWNAFVATSAYYFVVARVFHDHGFRGEFRIADR